MRFGLLGFLAAWLTGLGAFGLDGLLHQWSFDEGPDWHDDPLGAVCTATEAGNAVGGTPLRLRGMGPDAWVSGQQFTGVRLDGIDDSLGLPAAVEGLFEQPLSLSFMVRTDMVGSDELGEAPGIAGGPDISWGRIDAAGRMVLVVRGKPVVRTPGPVNDGLWHHVVLMRDPETGQCGAALDGRPAVRARGRKGTRGRPIQALGVVTTDSGKEHHFRGRLDGIHLFAGRLSDDRIAVLADNHAPKSWEVRADGPSNREFTTPSVLFRSYDPERDPLSVSSYTQPSHGFVRYDGNGAFLYTSDPGYAGPDSFTAVVTDGRGGFSTAHVDVTVTPQAEADGASRTLSFSGFAPLLANGEPLPYAGFRVPRALDRDGDGDADLLVGCDGKVWFHRNEGTPEAPRFAAGIPATAGGRPIDLGRGSLAIATADMNGDGRPDLVAVPADRIPRVYLDIASTDPAAFGPGTPLTGADGSPMALPDVRFDIGDWNNDGLPDIVHGTRDSAVGLLLNTGTAERPAYGAPETLLTGAYNLYPRLADLNRNGTTDFVWGINWGSITYRLDPALRGDGAPSGVLAVADADGRPVDLKAATDGAAADFADLNGDGAYDLIVGGHAGAGIFLAPGEKRTVAEQIARIEAIYDANFAAVGKALDADDGALLAAVRGAYAGIITHVLSATLPEREEIFAEVAAHVGRYSFLHAGAPLPEATFRHVPSIAGQNLLILHVLLPDTPAHRLRVAEITGLKGLHREIYLESALHVGDAFRASRGQLESIRDFMRHEPREIFPDFVLTLDHYYRDGRGGLVNTFGSTKNTFNFGEGGSANEWAPDLTAAIEREKGPGAAHGDYFTLVMGHEATHSLDGYVAGRRNRDLDRRRRLMLTHAAGPHVAAAEDGGVDWDATKTRFAKAGLWSADTQPWEDAWKAYWESGPGKDRRNSAFMRGGIDWFLAAPQEALATQANHHWVDSEGRLIAALDRFERGMEAPINEAVTFLDFVSAGLNKVVMYDVVAVKDPYPHAEYRVSGAWLERDDRGRIARIRVGGKRYDLETDDRGVVTSVRRTEVPAVPDAED